MSTIPSPRQRAEQAYNDAKAAAERRYAAAIHATHTLRGGNAVRAAARKAADDQLAVDYRAAQDAYYKALDGAR